MLFILPSRIKISMKNYLEYCKFNVLLFIYQISTKNKRKSIILKDRKYVVDIVSGKKMKFPKAN